MRLVRVINLMCGPRISVSRAGVEVPDFDARRSCTGRVYRYRVLNSPVPNPLAADLCRHVERRLDPRAMRAAADRLLGEDDFSSVCRRNPSHPDQSMVRTAWWIEAETAV